MIGQVGPFSSRFAGGGNETEERHPRGFVFGSSPSETLKIHRGAEGELVRGSKC